MYVSIGALVLLILILIVVGVSMSQLQSLDPFPPTMNACPDYWDVSSNPAYCGFPLLSSMRNQGSIVTASNQIDQASPVNIGMCTAGTSNFGCNNSGGNTYLNLSGTTPKFQYMQLNNNPSWSILYPGRSERCAQKSWAQTMGITWDGVSNYNGC
jgi:hypothetical protein